MRNSLKVLTRKVNKIGAYVKTLKDTSGNTIYPQTQANIVALTGYKKNESGDISEHDNVNKALSKLEHKIENISVTDTDVSVSPDVATALGLTGDPQVKDALEKLSGAALTKTTYTELSTLADGAEFTLNETIGGTTATAKFIKLKNNYEGSGRTLVIRKDAIAAMTWNSAGNNAYAGSTLDTYLNSTYLGYLDATVQLQIADINIPYTPGNGTTTVSTLFRKCFVPSVTEYGLSDSNANTEGSAVSYLASNSKIVYNNTITVAHCTRTPAKSTTMNAFFIGSSGALGDVSVTNTSTQARPAFTLPGNFEVGDYPIRSLTDMLGDDFPLPYAKIETGSYTGTGTFGESNPNSYAVSSKTKLLFIQLYGSLSFAVIPVWALDNVYRRTVFLTVGTTGSDNDCYFKKEGNTIYWYTTASSEQAKRQLNSGKYYVTEIG